MTEQGEMFPAKPWWQDGQPVARNTDLCMLRTRAKDPVGRCPSCGSKTKVYRRKLNSGMSRTICWMARYKRDSWVAQEDMPPKVEQYATELGKLEMWRLVRSRINPEGDRYRASHQWQITPAGVEFAYNRSRVPSHIFLQSPENAALGFEDSTTDVVEALGKHFDFWELMHGE